MKKHFANRISFIISLALVFLLCGPFSVFAIVDEQYFLKQQNAYVDVSGTTSYNIKVRVVTPSSNKVWYKPSQINTNFSAKVWINDGIGTYKISIMKHLYKNVYGFLKTFEISNLSATSKYLLPGENIESDNPEIVARSKSITNGLTTDLEKAKQIYQWVTHNITYDLRKYKKMLNNDYNSEYGALATLHSLKGVCYDYATLYAALGRSADLQVKVITGNYKIGSRKLYHAWNEVYIDSLRRWISLDASMSYVKGIDNFDRLSFSYEATGEMN